jgi:hypothetical protein
MSNNEIGQPVLPEGWSTDYIPTYTGDDKYKHTDGRKQATAPEGSCARAEGIIALASAIPNMGRLLSLDISSNDLYAEGTTLLAQAVKGNQIMTALNISSNLMTYDGEKLGDMSGVAALVDAIPNMGAISIVNLEKNEIKVSNELCMTLLRCAIDSRCGPRIKVEEGNDFSVVNKHTMEFVLLEMFGKEAVVPTEVNVESAGLTGITIAQ